MTTSRAQLICDCAITTRTHEHHNTEAENIKHWVGNYRLCDSGMERKTLSVLPLKMRKLVINIGRQEIKGT